MWIDGYTYPGTTDTTSSALRANIKGSSIRASTATQVLSSILTVVRHDLLLGGRKPHTLAREPKVARKDVLLWRSRALRHETRPQPPIAKRSNICLNISPKDRREP